MELVSQFIFIFFDSLLIRIPLHLIAAGAPAPIQPGSVVGQYCFEVSEDDIIPLQAPIITSPSAGQQITSQALSVTLSALDVPANQLVTVTIGSSGPIYVMANAAGRISTVLSLSTFPDGAITITITTIASQSSSVTVTKNAVNARS